MRIVVVFNEPNIKNPDSEEATNAIQILSDELNYMTIRGYDWWIEDAVGDSK